jgi:hypothetical protein
LEVTVLPNARTGLTVPYIFYFGNSIGEAGDSSNNAKVDPVDELLARANLRTLLNPAPIDFPYDYDRNQRVDAADQLIARANQTTVSALSLIDLSLVAPANVSASSSGFSLASLDSEGRGRISPLALRVSWQSARGNLVVEAAGSASEGAILEQSEGINGPWVQVNVPAQITGALVRWALPFDASASARFFRVASENR